MSILIKGLEMPRDDEMLCINIYPDGKVCINLDLKCERIATAIHVPAHGRLFDADVLMREMHNVILEDGEDRRIFYSVIERQPTIIPAEWLEPRTCQHGWLDWLKQESKYV